MSNDDASSRSVWACCVCYASVSNMGNIAERKMLRSAHSGHSAFACVEPKYYRISTTEMSNGNFCLLLFSTNGMNAFLHAVYVWMGSNAMDVSIYMWWADEQCDWASIIVVMYACINYMTLLGWSQAEAVWTLAREYSLLLVRLSKLVSYDTPWYLREGDNCKSLSCVKSIGINDPRWKHLSPLLSSLCRYLINLTLFLLNSKSLTTIIGQPINKS